MSIQFDGAVAADDVINCGSGASIDNIFASGGSISAWIYATGWGEGSFGRICQKQDVGGTNGWGLILDNSAASGANSQCVNFFHYWNTVSVFWESPTNSLTLNAWHHVALVYDKSSSTNDPVIYIDGVSQSITESSIPGGAVSSDAAETFYIGNRSDGTRTFDGQITELAVWNASLTQADVTLLYGSKIKGMPFQIKPTNLKGYWRLNESSDGSAFTGSSLDATGNGNTGTPSNNPTGKAETFLSYAG